MDYKEVGRRVLYFLFDPLVHIIKKLGITPNHITLIGLLLNIWAVLHLISYTDLSVLSYGENLVGFGFILGFAGLMDTIDGRLARLYDMKSSFGAFFDSVIDRYSEFIMFLGILLYFMNFDHMTGVVFGFIALMGSIMVSYNRSRAEALGVDCSIGFMQRPERIVFVGLWTILWGVLYKTSPSIFDIYIYGVDIFAVGFIFLAVSTNITAMRRMLHSQKLLLEQSGQ